MYPPHQEPLTKRPVVAARTAKTLDYRKWYETTPIYARDCARRGTTACPGFSGRRSARSSGEAWLTMEGAGISSPNPGSWIGAHGGEAVLRGHQPNRAHDRRRLAPPRVMATGHVPAGRTASDGRHLPQGTDGHPRRDSVALRGMADHVVEAYQRADIAAIAFLSALAGSSRLGRASCPVSEAACSRSCTHGNIFPSRVPDENEAAADDVFTNQASANLSASVRLSLIVYRCPCEFGSSKD